MDVAYIIVLATIAAIASVVFYLFKYGLKEKTYEENAAEQKKKYGSKLKPKYSQQKKPTKPPAKEKPNVEKKLKVTFQNPVGKEIKKPEPPNIPSAVDKPDGTANVKKKPDKIQPKPVNSIVASTNDKSQPLSNVSGKPNTEPLIVKVSVNGTSDDASNNVSDALKNLSTSCAAKNDTNNNIPVNKSSPLNDSTDAEDTDSSYNNDRTNSVSYYNSNTLNGEKLLKNKPASATGSDTESSQKSKSTESTGGPNKVPQLQKKSKEEGAKNVKNDEKSKDKPKKADDKVAKNSKETPSDKPKIPASPSKNKKPEDKSKNQAETIVANSIVPSNAATHSGDEKEPKVKNDKKVELGKSAQAVSVDQNVDKKPNDEKDAASVAKSAVKKPSSSLGGKTSPVQNGKQAANANKAAKRQATEIKALQKITNENDGPVNVNLLMPLIAKAELSRTEIQNLIDLLLNKQQEDCIIDAEWIEGSRQDPVAKLKKQLTEKEKQLAAEQEAHQAIQSKLKELRSELNVEKHNSRQLEETLNGRQVDLQSLNAKLQAALEEKQNFTKQLQQLQSQLNEERMIMHSLKEENSKTKSSLQQELLSQRQQLEVHIAQLNEQHQQAIVALESQLGQMAAQLHEQEAANAQMSEELRDSVLLREQIAMQDNQIAHLRQTATATQELAIQLEELRAIRAELDRHLANSQFEVTRLNNELKSVSEQLSRRNGEIEKFNSTVQNMKIENQELLKENARINEQINNAYSEKKQLQIENDKLREQLLQSSQQSKSAQDIEQLENELNKYKTFVNEKTTEITELNNRIGELKASLQQNLARNAELEKLNQSVKEIEDNFKKQLKKNDELRCKNWNAMDALSTLEKSYENKVKEIRNLTHEIKVKEREELISRLKSGFIPDTELNSNPASVEDSEWFNNVEKWLKMVASSSSQQQQQQQQQKITETSTSPPQRQLTNSTSSSVEDKVIPDAGQVKMLNALEKQNTKLQSMVSHYKDIICDTEGMLNRLEQQVKQQENQWIKQIQALELKIESLSKEKELLSSQVKMQNGCSKEEADDVEHNFKFENSANKATSILTANANATSAAAAIANS